MTRDLPGSHKNTIKGYLPFVAQHSTLVAKSVLIGSLLVTLMAWYFVRGTVEEKARERFHSQALNMQAAISQRMLEYESVLRGGVGLLQASENVSREEWKTYAEALDVLTVFRGIQGLGYAEVLLPEAVDKFTARVRREGFNEFAISPAGVREVYSSVLYIEPFDQYNQRTFGFDMLTDPVRREAMQRAAATGRAAVTGKVTPTYLDSEPVKTDIFIFLPVYHSPGTGLTNHLPTDVKSFVFAWFHMDELVADMVGSELGDVRLQLYDGASAEPGQLLFDSGVSDLEQEISTSETITVAGRPWTVKISSADLITRAESLQPLLVAIGGVLIDLLLFAVLMLISKRRESAERLALEMTEELTELTAAMKRSTNRLVTAFENMPTGVIVCDGTGVIEIFNSAAVKMFGYQPEEVLGKNLSMLMPTAYAEEHQAYIEKYLETGQANIIGIGRDAYATKKDGNTFPIHLGVGEVDVDGKPLFIGAITDLTEIRTLKSQLEHSQRMDAIGQLTGGVAHDFNNIMTVIMGSAELLAEQGGMTEASKRYVQDILKSVDSGASLTNMLLAFTRQQRLTPEVLYLDQVVAGVSSLISRTIGEQVELAVVTDVNVARCLIDPAQFEHALLNLCLNARDAMPKGGMVRIETRNETLVERYQSVEQVEPGNYVAVEVSDTGDGIEPDAIERVLEPFYTTKPEGKGTGLGLSMVYGFVKQSGGYISIDSQLGKGTSITMLFPVTTEALSSKRQQRTEEDLRGTEKILVVEDDPEVRRLPVKILENHGYEVFEAESGEMALTQLMNHGPFDLLFTDVVLPGEMHGVKLAISARARQPGLKVLFTSGYIRPKMMSELPADNQDPLLRKPYLSVELLQAVRKLLRHSAIAES